MRPGSEGEAARSTARQPKVLIVDDEPDVLESTALLVEALGYEVIRVSDPGAILETVEREQPALVLQDLRMPDLNVAGLVATLRSNPATAEVPLVFFSAGNDLPTTAARYDAWGYLPKPFGKEELASLLERVAGPAPHARRPVRGRDVRREVRSVFHDYWNLLAAMSNYVQLLGREDSLDADAKRSVQGLGDILLKLESKTDRLRAYLMSLLEGLEEEPPGKAEAADGR